MSAVQERERRATAGKRMTFLAGQELENDQAFWGHETWQEDSDSFHSSDADSDAVMDEFDSDFDESESDHEDEEEALGAAEEREIAVDERNKNKRGSGAAAAYTDTKNKKKVAGLVGAGVVKKGRWSRGKRIMGDGLNAGIVLNIPPAYQLQQQEQPPAAVAAALATTQLSVSSVQTSQPLATAATAPTGADGAALFQIPLASTFSAGPAADAAIAIPLSASSSTTAVIKLPQPLPPRKKAPLGPTLAATRVRRNTEGRVRGSTAASTKAATKTPAAASKAVTPTTKQLKKGKRAFTQEELLLEAVKETEPENERWLLGRKRSQAEKDDKESSALGGGDGQKGGKVIEKFVSRRGYLNTITFPDMDHIPELLRHYGNNSTASPSKKAACVITGKVARYRDPKTGMGYHDAAAFKELRRRHAAMVPLGDTPEMIAAASCCFVHPATKASFQTVGGSQTASKAAAAAVEADIVSTSAASTTAQAPKQLLPPKSVSNGAAAVAKRKPSANQQNGKPKAAARKKARTETKTAKDLPVIPQNVDLKEAPNVNNGPEVVKLTAFPATPSATQPVAAPSIVELELAAEAPSKKYEAPVTRKSAILEVEVNGEPHHHDAHKVASSPRLKSAPGTTAQSPPSPDRRSPRRRKLTAKALENMASGPLIPPDPGDQQPMMVDGTIVVSSAPSSPKNGLAGDCPT